MILPVSNLPREDAVVIEPILLDSFEDLLADALLGPRSTQHSGADASGFLIAVEDLGDASVRHSQLA